MRRWLAGVVLLTLAGCGSNGSEVVVLPPTGPRPTQPSFAPSGGASKQPLAAHATPHSGLKDGQTVHVTATGFTPDGQYLVVECADKGKKTGQGDCDLANLTSAAADADGKIEVDVTVRKGPFGANQVVCSSTQPCLISVTEATLNPSQEADATISFG